VRTSLFVEAHFYYFEDHNKIVQHLRAKGVQSEKPFAKGLVREPRPKSPVVFFGASTTWFISATALARRQVRSRIGVKLHSA
jgi:hypothetical protein